MPQMVYESICMSWESYRFVIASVLVVGTFETWKDKAEATFATTWFLAC